jgi:hypothetical protein
LPAEAESLEATGMEPQNHTIVAHPQGEQRYSDLASSSRQIPPIWLRLAIIQLPDLGLRLARNDLAAKDTPGKK